MLNSHQYLRRQENLKKASGTSLVVQWIRIHLAAQWTGVQSPVPDLRPHMPQGQLGPGNNC